MDAEDEVDVVALARVLWGYKRLIVLTTTVSIAVAAILAFTATPIYRAQVALTEVHDSNMSNASALGTQLGGLAGLAGLNLGSSSPGREARAVLQSRHLVEEFIRRNSLLPVLSRGAQAPVTLWRSVEQFRSGVLQIHLDTVTGITTVAIDWTDPVVAARWANGFVATANDLLRSRALDESTRNLAYLNAQLAKTSVLEVQHALYNLIESETKTLMLANGRIEYAFTIVDPAVPPEVRTRPKRVVLMALGMLVGLFVGTIIALSHYRLRREARGAPQNR